jgi:hypothetical protein
MTTIYIGQQDANPAVVFSVIIAMVWILADTNATIQRVKLRKGKRWNLGCL